MLDLNPEPGSELDDMLEVITTLVHAYEQVHHPIAEPDPIEALKYIMEVRSLKYNDL